MDLRCFIAIELPEDIKRNIDAHIERLRAAKADVKWIPSKNLHITLKFLGKTSEGLIPDINRKLSETAKLHSSFNLRIFGAGVFPNVKYPRIVWLGIEDSEKIIKLRQDVDDAMKEFGFVTEDRDFKPHLTVGRVRSQKNKDMLIKELSTLKEADFGKIEVIGIALMKSELKPGGAEYFRMSEIPLQKHYKEEAG